LSSSAKAAAARMGPTVCELDGPIPMENRSKTPTAMMNTSLKDKRQGTMTQQLGGIGTRSPKDLIPVPRPGLTAEAGYRDP